MLPEKLRALIVGGGFGGCSLAIRLAEFGHRVTLIDCEPEWGPVGAGLTLNGATLRALASVGVGKDVALRGHIHGGRRVHRRDGTIISDAPSFRPAADDLSAMGGIMRPVLHKILAQRVDALGVEVRFALSVESLRQFDGKVDVTFTDGASEPFDVVIGADGIFSTVRSLILPSAPRPKFTGQGAWRAVFPRPADVATNQLYLDPGFKLGLNPVSDEEMYMFILESAPDNPWRPPATWVNELRARLNTCGGLPRHLARHLGKDSHINYRPLESVFLPLPWHVGSVVLIGDAVHATTPHAGYGAGLAIEDAIVLAECLDTMPLGIALEAYERGRYRRCREIVQASLDLGQLEMAGAPMAEQIAASAELFKLTRQPFEESSS